MPEAPQKQRKLAADRNPETAPGHYVNAASYTKCGWLQGPNGDGIPQHGRSIYHC